MISKAPLAGTFPAVLRRAEEFQTSWEMLISGHIDNHIFESDELLKHSAWFQKETVQDIVLFTLIVLFYEIPVIYTEYYVRKALSYTKIEDKRKIKKAISALSYLYDNLSEHTDSLTYYLIRQAGASYTESSKYDALSNEKISDFTAGCKQMLEYLKAINPEKQDEPTGVKFNNYLLSREMNSDTGLRNLSLRYITFCLQIAGIYRPETGVFYFIYALANVILPPDVMGSLKKWDTYKYIQDINIGAQGQNYLKTLIALGNDLEPPMVQSAITPAILQWQSQGLSWARCQAFFECIKPPFFRKYRKK